MDLVNAVYFHIDPSRSAEAAHKLFAGALLCTVIVCDRYSAYKKLARLLGGVSDLGVLLGPCALLSTSQPEVELTRGWIGRIAETSQQARLDPGIKRQTPSFDAAQDALKEALEFAQAAGTAAASAQRALPRW